MCVFNHTHTHTHTCVLHVFIIFLHTDYLQLSPDEQDQFEVIKTYVHGMFVFIYVCSFYVFPISCLVDIKFFVIIEQYVSSDIYIYIYIYMYVCVCVVKAY